MAYAAGAAHFHRLPALRAPMQELMKHLILKMLRRDVWSYWYLTSQSGNRADPDLKELRKPWADPVKKENIMYSGHLLLMISLYGMLFDSDDFEKDDSISFDSNPIFWGLGPESFKYSRSKIQQVILDQMEKNNWVGVCCEPNVVFVVCNQFPIIAMRYVDARYGTNVVERVLEKYKAAIEHKGMIRSSGLFSDWWMVKQDLRVPADEAAFTAWGAAFMNGWNSKQVRDMYPAQAMGTLTKQENGRINVERPDVAAEMRKLVATQGADPDAHATRQEARKIAVSQRQAGFPFTRPTFGYAAMWAAEVGAPEDLDGLLKHAHRYLNPCWSKGGLYYPRNDTWEDSEGNWRFVDPFTGNGAIGYARLNVPDGQKKLWEQAWSSETVQKKVAAEGVSFANGADFLRCEWVSEAGAGFTSLVITMRTWHGQKTSICPRVVNLPAGRYGVYIDGVLTRYCEQDKGLAMELEVEVGGDEMTIGVLQE